MRDDSGLVANQASVDVPITINAPPKAQIAAPASAAPGERVRFDGSASADSDGKIVRYRWMFGKDREDNGPAIEHSFARPGAYQVRLLIEDDGPGLCTTLIVWDFGDGGKAEGVNVSHVYPLSGTYIVQLRVTDASGTASAMQSAQQKIRVNAPPVADAGPDQLIAPGGTVQFDGSRSVDPDGSISSFTWQVQGQQYKGEKFTHRFEQSGGYQISLTVVDNDGASHSDALTMTVNSPPIAQMQALPRVEPGKEILFDASSSADADGSITAYMWDFGDGGKAARRQVKHVYAEPGRYQVVLTVQDNSGAANDTVTARQTVAVNFPPKADGGKDVHTCGQFVQFDGSASSDPDQDPLAYHWDFGDQSSGQGVTVGHQFAAPGLYPVSLRVNDGTGLGNSSDEKKITVQINHPPKAVIRSDGELFCVGEHVLFDGSLSSDPEGGPLRYIWDLGGQQVEGANPVRVYEQAGEYPINLTVLDDSGLECNAGQARKNIRLIAAPVARAGEDLEVCSNAPVAFDGTASTGGERPIVSYAWNFDDGCVGEPLTFDAAESAAANGKAVQYSWNFGDGAGGAGVSATHSYGRTGTYTVRLKASDPNNTVCSSSENSREIKINLPPVPRIRWSVAGKAMSFETPQTVLPNTVLHFSAAESMDNDGIISKVNWDFGDGQQAEGWFVEHSFKEPGQYAVRLTVKDDAKVSCSKAQAELPVYVAGQPALRIDGPQQVCVNQEVRYKINGAAEQASWDFGTGLKAEGKEADVRFPQAGMREIHTVVDGQPGPSQTVQVLSLPEIALPEQLTVLAGEDLSITPALLDKTGVQPFFSWDSGDGTTTEDAIFRHSYSRPGKHTVRLRVSGGSDAPACLAAEKEIAVTVLPPPEARILHMPEQIFSGGARDEVLFQAELRNGQGAWSYHWDFGDKSKAEGATVSHAFQKPGSYTVTLMLIDGSGIARKPYNFSKKINVKTHEAKPAAR